LAPSNQAAAGRPTDKDGVVVVRGSGVAVLGQACRRRGDGGKSGESDKKRTLRRVLAGRRETGDGRREGREGRDGMGEIGAIVVWDRTLGSGLGQEFFHEGALLSTRPLLQTIAGNV